MIKIYSIKEVIDASNNILKRTKKKTKVNKTLKSKSNKENILQKDIPLILTEAVSDQINLKVNQNEPNLKNQKKEQKSIKQTRQYKLIDQLYLKFNKKIRRNTLKVIFELQKEVSDLNDAKNFLQTSNQNIKLHSDKLNSEFLKINNINKKLIEDKLILNEKIVELTGIVETSKYDIEKLKINKLQLEKDLKDRSLLKEQITKLSEKLKSSESEITSLNQDKAELEESINNYKTQEEINRQKIYDISEIENKNKFFQEENLRIGSELLEVKKKHDILRKEIEKYENQKSNLISKINPVNEALNDTNVLTNVFENKVENKINVIDHNKIEKKISSDLDEQILNIFSDKS